MVLDSSVKGNVDEACAIVVWDVFVFRGSGGHAIQGRIRRSGCMRGAPATQKKTGVCSCCGRKRCSIYDRRVARARDLGAGGFRIELEFERVRVSCPDWGGGRGHLDWA